MTSSISKAAYTDCFDLFDRALDAPNGIRKRATDDGQALNLRQRLHYARTLKRRESFEVYPPDSPHYGTSPYDNLIVQVKQDDGAWWVYIKPRLAEGDIEELKAAE